MDIGSILQENNPLNRFAQGFQIGAVMRQQQALAAEKEAKAEEIRKQAERAGMLQTSLNDIATLQDPNEKVTRLTNLGVQYPELVENINKVSQNINEQAKSIGKNTYLPILYAIKNKNYDVAKKLSLQGAEAFKNSGNTRGYETLQGVVNRIDNNENLDTLFVDGSMLVSSILGWDTTMQAMKAGEETAQQGFKTAQEQSMATIKAEEAKRGPLETKIKEEQLKREPTETLIKQAELQTKQAEAKTKEQTILADLDLKRQQLKASKANEAQSWQSVNESRARTQQLQKAQQPTNGTVVDLGLPVPARLPWANMTDEKQRNIMMANTYKTSEKELNKREEDNADILATKDLVKRFINLNSKIETGGFLDRQAIGRGLGGITNSEYDEMRAISAQLIPRQRPAGSGSTSDSDMRLYEKATLGVDKSRETNLSIANALLARARNAEDYQSYLQEYLTQNGTLADADRRWQEYSKKNPILDPKKEGQFVLNKNRIPYQSYFALQREKEARGLK